MKRNKLSTVLKMCVIFVSCLVIITACKQDNNDVLYGGKVALLSFGPCPIQRGAELRIIGTNLGRVTSVILPGTAPITGDAIKQINSGEIRVIVPQDAEPGLISIQVENQKPITSITPLTFNEPILINSITPLTVKPGTVIKIEGDYLNLIEEIIFLDDVHVLKAGFVSQSREAIEVAVPLEAQSGKIIVSNGADIIPDAEGNVGIPIWVYSNDELNVILPKITTLSPNPIKTGNVLTIEGTDFDLVDSLAFEGSVGLRNFVSKTATKIEVDVPANANEGFVKLIAFSGVEVESPDSLKLVAPAITSISPNPVKNGATLTITGTDLDLVSSVVFTGSKSDANILDGGTATSIQVTIPDDATDGVVTLNTSANQKTLSAELTLIRPIVTAYNPSPAPAGSDVILQGTDLDLVVSVAFNDLVVPVTPTSSTELTVKVPVFAVSGTPVLTMTNGVKVNCPNLDIISPAFAFLVVPPGPDAEIHAGELLTVEVGNGSKLTDVQVNGVSTNFILNNTTLYILIPNRAAGKCELKLVSSNGEVSYTIPVIGAGTIETIIWEGAWTLQWGACLEISQNYFQDVPVGSKLKVYYTITNGGSADLAFVTANWSNKIPTGHEWSKDDNTLGLPEGTTSVEIVLSAEFFQAMKDGVNTWNDTWVMLQGDGAIVSKVSVITAGAPQETVLWSGNVGPIEWNANANTLVGPVDMSLVSAGQTLGVDFVVDSGGGQMEVYAGSWWVYLDGWQALNGGARYIKDCAASETNIEFTLTQSDIDHITEEGSTLFFAGNDIYIKRLYVK